MLLAYSARVANDNAPTVANDNAKLSHFERWRVMLNAKLAARSEALLSDVEAQCAYALYGVRFGYIPDQLVDRIVLGRS